MANLIYLTLNGQNQGLISAGCSSLDSIGNKAQLVHLDQIMVYELTHSLSRDQNVNHHSVTIKKPIDKSSPLLGKAINDNEILTCSFDFYRTNRFGINEKYYKLTLTKARIRDISFSVAHVIIDNDIQPQESLSFIYETINWEHCIAGTSAYSLWHERIY
ncbi:Hcp family type VI secretion system effector [Escherichia albertii]|uniref:Hcp family type VI secretion system effector n=1 Tax=Escherichia albertii TaxID=208962 RepID=UPI0017BA4E14|nr:Hcp family type VI secretion system effector [Escherichia albertii]EFO0323496.1 Hcp family type VI secretion system effector [Escherichia albertii]EGE0301659.1 type VI secretion system tube protein Hcp [Escherichia albertii]EKD4815143.1 Hcp family type VI secretion system effector [Escherichia albertii]MCI5279727.1 Hcp family type VI secretion system effector [Escherichia albertii]MCZ8663617.1 Hcp family type VI secretion system effector [Escherichia albertii]